MVAPLLRRRRRAPRLVAPDPHEQAVRDRLVVFVVAGIARVESLVNRLVLREDDRFRLLSGDAVPDVQRIDRAPGQCRGLGTADGDERVLDHVDELVRRVEEELAVAAVVDLALEPFDGQHVALLLRDRARLLLDGLLEGQDERVGPVLALERQQLLRRLAAVGVQPLVAAHAGAIMPIDPHSPRYRKWPVIGNVIRISSTSGPLPMWTIHRRSTVRGPPVDDNPDVRQVPGEHPRARDLRGASSAESFVTARATPRRSESRPAGSGRADDRCSHPDASGPRASDTPRSRASCPRGCVLEVDAGAKGPDHDVGNNADLRWNIATGIRDTTKRAIVADPLAGLSIAAAITCRTSSAIDPRRAPGWPTGRRSLPQIRRGRRAFSNLPSRWPRPLSTLDTAWERADKCRVNRQAVRR